MVNMVKLNIIRMHIVKKVLFLGKERLMYPE